MGDENPIRAREDYSKPSHKGYENTIELLEGNNVVPLQSDTIRERRSTIGWQRCLGFLMNSQSARLLKYMNALVDQGSNINAKPLSTNEKLTNENPAETDIRLSLASHPYIYPLGIAEDVLVDVAGHVYPVDFVILNIREDEKRPFMLGTPFLTTAKAVIKFDKG
ncbi:ribonuclease H-like domain-containing protein [Tanacetum coccineum]